MGPGGLVVLPEMATTGYVFRDREEITPYVEPVPGPTTRLFGRLARERGTSLILGMPEVDPATGAYYNSAVLIGPDGGVAGLYRKTHSFYCDTRWAAEGDLGLPVFRGPWPGPVGLLICMDAGFIEPARVLALRGARVLAFPTNWLRAAPSPEWRARAAENGVYLVAADRWGEERGTRFAGGSCIIGPRGQILARRDRGDGVVAAEAPLSASVGPTAEEGLLGESVAETKTIGSRSGGPGFGGLVRRRPELYHDLLRHSHLWPARLAHPGLGEGRFRVSAGEPAAAGKGPGDGAERPAGEGQVAVLPPRPLRDLLDRAARSGAYLAAAVGPREEVVLAGPAGLVGRYVSPHRLPAGRVAATDEAAPSGPAREDGETKPFRVFDLPFARVGLLHSLDLLIPEAARILAKLGADVVLVSGSWPEDLDDLRFLWSERAQPNDIVLAVATDRGGGVFRGGEEPAALGPGEELTVETGPWTYTRRKDVLRRLRPDLYLPLVAPGPAPAAGATGPAGPGAR